MVERLSVDARLTALADLVGWQDRADRDAISKRFTFETFAQAFAFMTAVAGEAEDMDHHPSGSTSTTASTSRFRPTMPVA